MDLELDELQQEVLLDHYKRPRCLGSLPAASAVCRRQFPSCGDSIEVQVLMQGGVLQEVVFTGAGCALSRASASIMGELCRGKSAEAVQGYATLFDRMLRGERPDELLRLGDLQALAGISSFPARIECARLAWQALLQCVQDAEGGGSAPAPP